MGLIDLWENHAILLILIAGILMFLWGTFTNSKNKHLKRIGGIVGGIVLFSYIFILIYENFLRKSD